MRKAILGLCLAVLSALAIAGPNSIVLTQRNAADTGNIFRTMDNPPSDGVMIFNTAISRPGYLTIGPGLVTSNGMLQAAVPQGPPGPQGAQGVPGVTGATGAAGRDGVDGTPGAVGSTGAQGVQGIQGVQGPAGTPAPTFDYGLPVPRTIAVTTPYQATNAAKAADISVSPSCTASLTLAGGSTCTLQARIGSAPLTCSSGTVVATWTNGNTGALSIGLALNQTVGSPYAIRLPIGASFILCPTAGTFTVTAAEQSGG